MARGTVKIRECHVSPSSVTPGGTFTLVVKAESQGVSCLNFRIRTPYPAGEGTTPGGFENESPRGHAVLADHPSGNLMDNGRLDQDSADGVLKVPVSTAGLEDGVHYLVVFAHNRPAADEAHALDYRNLKIDVQEQRTAITVLGTGAGGLDEPVVFELPDPVPAPGGVVSVGVRWRDGSDAPLAVAIHSPYTWGEDEVLPGFAYNAKTKIGYWQHAEQPLIRDGASLDADPMSGRIRVAMDTTDWPSGVHCLTVDVPSGHRRAPYGGTGDVYRDFQVDIPAESDQLNVSLGEPVTVSEGTHFSALVSLGDGRIYTGSHLSTDGGRTWAKASEPAMPRPNLLPDGSLIAMSYKALPVAGRPGHYTAELFRSADGARTVDGPLESLAVVARARSALGHSRHVGPLFGRSIVELADGSLLAGMYGWFKGDTEPDRYRSGGTMRRAYTCRSEDGGRTWHYLSTIAYEPFLGNEGYSEVVIRALPDASLLALVRTGGNSNSGWQDNPLVISRSHDQGKTWSRVTRTGVEGVWPDLCVMSDGTLVCSTGRPGAVIMFSTDGGDTWTDHTAINPERYSGYTAVCEVAPGELLVGYGVRHGLDAASGQRRNMLQVVPVTVRKR